MNAERRMLKAVAAGAAAFLALSLEALAGGDLAPELHGKPAGPRFKIAARDWPAANGEASLCLWKGDALAAVSVTIDDNMAQDHAWWIEFGKRRSCRFTWFVITGRVETPPKRTPCFGNWDDFRKLKAEGHDIQSHTVDHLGSDMPVESSYADSIKDISSNLPGGNAICLAYPGGKNSSKNDIAAAMRHFIAARGVIGHLNKANEIRYDQVASIGGALFVEDEGGRPLSLKSCIDPASPCFRAWYCSHFHSLNDKAKDGLEKAFDFMAQAKGDFWVAPFSEVALYGMERDCASVSTKPLGDGGFSISLKSKLSGPPFSFPLTVKARVPGAGKIEASQDGAPLRIELIERDGARFLLAELAPNRGDAIVKIANER